ncbi:hypothetical protein NL676_002438 [Syzygium grande]|nr:hypothetical protein NL676_002438 [Syzygium grande]
MNLSSGPPKKQAEKIEKLRTSKNPGDLRMIRDRQTRCVPLPRSNTIRQVREESGLSGGSQAGGDSMIRFQAHAFDPEEDGEEERMLFSFFFGRPIQSPRAPSFSMAENTNGTQPPVASQPASAGAVYVCLAFWVVLAFSSFLVSKKSRGGTGTGTLEKVASIAAPSRVSIIAEPFIVRLNLQSLTKVSVLAPHSEVHPLK